MAIPESTRGAGLGTLSQPPGSNPGLSRPAGSGTILPQYRNCIHAWMLRRIAKTRFTA